MATGTRYPLLRQTPSTTCFTTQPPDSDTFHPAPDPHPRPPPHKTLNSWILSIAPNKYRQQVHVHVQLLFFPALCFLLNSRSSRPRRPSFPSTPVRILCSRPRTVQTSRIPHFIPPSPPRLPESLSRRCPPEPPRRHACQNPRPADAVPNKSYLPPSPPSPDGSQNIPPADADPTSPTLDARRSSHRPASTAHQAPLLLPRPPEIPSRRRRPNPTTPRHPPLVSLVLPAPPPEHQLASRRRTAPSLSVRGAVTQPPPNFSFPGR